MIETNEKVKNATEKILNNVEMKLQRPNDDFDYDGTLIERGTRRWMNTVKYKCYR